jgi:hypothetical protein
MESKEKKNKSTKNNDKEISLAPLEFEDVLSALLEIKPVDNAELRKDVPKQKGESISKQKKTRVKTKRVSD